jgi:bacterioferritin-associated ferredoxin
LQSPRNRTSPFTMIVCICHRVSDRDIANAVRHGCTSFASLQDELGVATRCGACADCARKTLAACAPERPVVVARRLPQQAEATA